MIALASMLALDRNALICDLAETYMIYDYRRVPGRTLGILAAGLGPNSRIGKVINGVRGCVSEILLARILDGIMFICWSKTEDGQKNRNRPKSVASEFFISEDKNKAKATTIEDFEAIRRKITGGQP